MFEKESKESQYSLAHPLRPLRRGLGGMTSDDKIITSTKNMLNYRFAMKDMGLANVILGIKIKRTSD